MPVITLPFGALEANCHIVHNGTDAVVFDPSDDTAVVLRILSENKLNLRAIALTHLHCDHCLGCAEMSKATGLVPLIGLEDWLERGNPRFVTGWIMAAAGVLAALGLIVLRSAGL